MKPVSLRIKGIKNYQTEQFIDFESLSSEGVFGICGKTGSGKSAIVESIIIALFGDLPSGRLDNYAVVNLIDKQAYIEFVFTLNKDGSTKKYLITRKLKTLNGNKMDAEIFDITQEKISLASGARDVKNFVIDLLKIDEKDFTQCVILEQGQYDKFVKADASERKKMIGNIFSLNKYGEELHNKVLEYRQKYAAQVQTLQSLLSGMGEIDKKAIDNKKKELLDCQSDLDKATLLKDQADLRLKELEKQYDEYIRYLDLREKIKKAQQDKAELEIKIKKLEEDYNLKSEQAKEIKALTRQKEEIKSYIDSLNNNKSSVDKIKTLTEEKNKKAQEYKQTRGEINQIKESLQNARIEQEKRISLINDDLTGIKNLTQISLTFDDNLAVALTEKFKEYDSSVQSYLKLSSDLKEHQETVNNNTRELEGYYVLQGELLQKANEYKKTLEELKGQKERLAIHNARVVLRSQIKLGDNCPVCGNIVKELPQDLEIVNLDDINNKINYWEKIYYDLSAAQAAQAEKISNLEKDIKERKEKIKNIQDEILSLGLNEDCQKTKEQFQKKKDNCLNLIQQHDKTQKYIQDQTAQLEKKETLLGQIEERGKDLARQIEEHQENLNKVLRGYANFDDAIKDSQERYLALDAKIQALENAEKAADKALSQARQDLIKIMSDLDNYQNNISGLNSKEVSQDQLDQARAQKTQYEELQSQLSQKLGELKSDLERLEQDLELYQKRKKELDEAQKKLDLISQLHKLTVSNKLMEFMAEEYIEEFTYTASEYLNMLTMGQFELVYQNGFFIKDHFCGGEIRKVNTVSGGEMFLVSLSLAVAISRALSRRSGAAAVEFLFIDEGFGTLDSDLIDTVMDALEKLKDSFVIGLISHRTELQQRLPKKLYVERTSSGSVIKY
ncbi:MAG TPA: SMC family ATPase [Clostridia bacterium]